MTYRRIIVSGDFLRPGEDGVSPTQHFNIQWCRDLLKVQLEAATGLPVEMLAWKHDSVVSGRLDKAAIANIYANIGLPCSVNSWAQIYNETALPDRVQAYLAELFYDSLVVAFELPPYLEGVLRSNGIPFVDLMVHPVRFLDDVFLGARSSDPSVNEEIARFAISEEFVKVVAGLQSAGARRDIGFAPRPDSALVLLQTRFDRTQIRKGRFCNVETFVAEIARIAAEHDVVYLKEHPFDRNLPQSEALRRRFRNIEMTTENVYRLMACDTLAHVVSLSSSAGIEARYFGKRSTFLLQEPSRFALDGQVPSGSEFVGVFDAFLTPDFWRTILQPLTPVTRASGVRVPFKPNRLRTSLRNFWNFNEIDTDLLPKPAL